MASPAAAAPAHAVLRPSAARRPRRRRAARRRGSSSTEKRQPGGELVVGQRRDLPGRARVPELDQVQEIRELQGRLDDESDPLGEGSLGAGEQCLEVRLFLGGQRAAERATAEPSDEGRRARGITVHGGVARKDAGPRGERPRFEGHRRRELGPVEVVAHDVLGDGREHVGREGTDRIGALVLGEHADVDVDPEQVGDRVVVLGSGQAPQRRQAHLDSPALALGLTVGVGGRAVVVPAVGTAVVVAVRVRIRPVVQARVAPAASEHGRERPTEPPLRRR